MKTRTQVLAGGSAAEARNANASRYSLMVLLLGALLIPMVGCGMHQNLVGPDTASLGSGPDVQDDGASKNPARRAPIEDPIVYAPEGLHIDDASWAWTVGWNSTNQDVTYQLFEYTGNGWTLMAQTRATQFFVPKTHSPNGLVVAIRAMDGSGAYSDFAPQVRAAVGGGDNGSGGGNGGGGGGHRTTADD